MMLNFRAHMRRRPPPRRARRSSFPATKVVRRMSIRRRNRRTRRRVREDFPTEVYDELEAVQQEIAELRHQLEFVPSGHSVHGTPLSSSAM